MRWRAFHGDQPSSFPVVMFSHGYQCVRTMDTDVMESLASYGYITLAIDHADAWASVFPSGQIVLGNASDQPPPAQIILNIQSRTRDVRFVLDELQQLNRQTRSSFLGWIWITLASSATPLGGQL